MTEQTTETTAETSTVEATAEAAAASTAAAETADGDGGSWSEKLTLDDDLKPFFEGKGYGKLDSPEAALAASVKAAKGAESALRAPPDRLIVLPEGGADAEFLKANGEKLGIPATVEGYDFERPQLPEGMEYDTALETKMLTGLHAAGATKAVAEAAVKTYAETMAAVYQADADALKDKSGVTMEALKTDWGQNFDSKIGMSKRATAHFAQQAGLDEEATRALIGRVGEAAGDTAMIKLMAAIGEAMSEDALILGDGITPLGQQLTKAEADAEAVKIRDSDEYKAAKKKGGKALVAMEDKITDVFKRVKKGS